MTHNYLLILPEGAVCVNPPREGVSYLSLLLASLLTPVQLLVEAAGMLAPVLPVVPPG